MKLFWAPKTCAIGIHILLEEVGANYATERVDTARGATRMSPFLSVNPKGKVPALMRDDGSVLTEFAAIATWIARQYPERELIPVDVEGEARSLETMEYVVGTIHGQGYGRVFAPEKFEPSDIVHQTLGLGRSAVRGEGRSIVQQGFAILDPQLGRHPYAAGHSFSIVDAALFYVERWAPQHDIALPINVQRHYEMMLARPAVHAVRRLWNEDE